MRFASLGSGSKGNALLIEASGTRILLDCGFNMSDVLARLSRVGLTASDLDAVIVTHEHDDHGGGVARLAFRYELPVYLTHGTLSAMGADGRAIPNKVLIDVHASFSIGAIEVSP
jgi:phosphoribosyl 1,2-cyclic phosphodiesterase